MSPTASCSENKLAQLSPQSCKRMSDIKPEFISKAVRKHAGRAKERFLQNLGKADRTTDEVFDDYVHNFTRQQNQAIRLNKEIVNYMRCTRAMQAASKSLMDTVYDMYEPEWVSREKLADQAHILEQLWADYTQKLRARVDEPVETYASQFPEVRRKVEKRGRKLVDYDSHRHHYEALQNSVKRRDAAKVDRQHQLLLDARQTFETVNGELYDELPALFDSRLPFLVSSMQNLFDIESNFLNGAAKVQSELEGVMDGLHKEATSGRYSTRRNSPKSPKTPTAPAPLPDNARRSLSSTSSDSSCDQRAASGDISTAGAATSSIKQKLSKIGQQFSVHKLRRGSGAGGRERVARSATFHTSSNVGDSSDEATAADDGACVLVSSHFSTRPFDEAATPSGGSKASSCRNPFLDGSSPPPSTQQPVAKDRVRRCASASAATCGTGFEATQCPPHVEKETEKQASVTLTADDDESGGGGASNQRASPAGEIDRDAACPVHVGVLLSNSACGGSVCDVDRGVSSGGEAGGAGAEAAATAAGGTTTWRHDNAAGATASATGAGKTNGSLERAQQQQQQLYDIPVGASTDNLPAGVLYRVKAAYRYEAEDTDELTFDVAELIDVVEYDDIEDQEEGWLMGVKQLNGQKGMFPANFTRPI